ncbi:MAG: hypothetical protein ACYSTT_13125 [Planctomycetota bacterium]|jgi:hypothetical protein
MSKSKKTPMFIKPLLIWISAGLLINASNVVQAAETEKPKTIEDIKPPFTFSISTTTPDGEPQPGVKIKCVHPRSQRGAAIVDTVATSDEKGVAAFNITKADLILDRYFWFSMADENFVGHPGVGISPIDNEYTYTFKVLPAEKYRILVLDKDGKPISEAKLRFFSDHSEFPRLVHGAFRAAATASTNDKGLASIKFAQIETNIMASAKGRASTFIRGVSLPKDEPYIIRFSPGYNITGLVVDADNNPIVNVKLSAKKKDFIMYYYKEFILQATSDTEGRFVLENATDGTYEIQALMQEPHETMYAKPVSVNVERDVSVAGVRILAEHGAVLKGRYVTKHKLRTADRKIFIITISPIRNNWEIQTKDDGSFVISGLPQEARGKIDFMGVSGYHESLRMTNTYPFFQIESGDISFNNVPPGVYEGVEVHFLLEGRITGKVFDSSGNPMPGQELIVRPRGRIHKTNDKGEYTAEIPPMEKVTITVRDPVSRQVIIQCEPFMIKEGETAQKNLTVGEESSKLVNQSLPDFEDIDIEFDPQQARNQKILVCFWDMNQRPSRYCIIELAQRANELGEKNITIVAVHASKADENELDEWVNTNNVSFPAGMIHNNQDETLFNWGVRSLPWLILTNNKHLVISAGFGLNELDDMIGAAN